VRRFWYGLFLVVFVLPMMVMGAAVSFLRWAERRLHLWQRDKEPS